MHCPTYGFSIIFHHDYPGITKFREVLSSHANKEMSTWIVEVLFGSEIAAATLPRKMQPDVHPHLYMSNCIESLDDRSGIQSK